MSDATVGYLACLVAVVCFGSNFVPAKKVNIGDGVFFQFIMCSAILMTSFPVLAIQKFPPFHNLAVLGGCLWCTGNMLCGPTINLIGMGMGVLVWGSANMVAGWATGTFGLFGLDKDEVSIEALNYVGIVFAVIGLAIVLQVKTNAMSTHESGDNLLDQEEALLGTKPTNSQTSSRDMILGSCMALTAGVLFGFSFNPAQYVNDSKYGGDDDGLNYVFPHFCGIFISSWSYTVIYFAYKWWIGEKAHCDASLVVPGALCGLGWGVACIAFFVANSNLGFSVSFPIIASGPGFVANLYGIFMFKEISGTRNYLIMALSFVVTIAGCIMISLSH